MSKLPKPQSVSAHGLGDVREGLGDVREGPILDKATQERIGLRLRELYDHLENQPIPEHLLTILERCFSVQDEAETTGVTGNMV